MRLSAVHSFAADVAPAPSAASADMSADIAADMAADTSSDGCLGPTDVGEIIEIEATSTDGGAAVRRFRVAASSPTDSTEAEMGREAAPPFAAAAPLAAGVAAFQESCWYLEGAICSAEGPDLGLALAEALLSAGPSAATFQDADGLLPLHLAAAASPGLVKPLLNVHSAGAAAKCGAHTTAVFSNYLLRPYARLKRAKA